MTEACNSFGVQSWGYREGENYYSMRHLIQSIGRVMAMGGSYLLNVGPDSLGRISPEFIKRLNFVGDWYNRMEGALECAEGDDYNYAPRHLDYVATKKNGKTYLHFYNGIFSDSISIVNYPSLPKSVRLMNTGAPLTFKIELLPEYFEFYTGKAEKESLHITGVPIDRLENEAIVVEIEW